MKRPSEEEFKAWISEGPWNRAHDVLQEAKRARAGEARLLEALERYGCHEGRDQEDPDEFCNGSDDWDPLQRARVVTKPCDCGLEEALYGAPVPVGTILWRQDDAKGET